MMSYIKWIEWIMLCEYAWYGYLPRCNIYTASRPDRIATFRFFKNLKRRTKDIKDLQKDCIEYEESLKHGI